MTRADVEKRRRRRDRTPDPSSRADETDAGDDRLGVVVVALLVGAGGAADLAAGGTLVASSLLPFGVVVAALGVLKLWVAVGLLRLRARALGIAVLLHVVSAMLGALGAIFALGTGGSAAAEILGVAVDAVVVGYLLVIADRFE